jgi:hypothetical protein
MAITKIPKLIDDIINESMNEAAKEIAREVDATILSDFYAHNIKDPVRFVLRSNIEQELTEFCSKNISPQSYYLHGHRIGGTGWQIRRLTGTGIEVIINDRKLATLMMLKWS